MTPASKAEWLADVSRRLPVGTFVTGPEWASVEPEEAFSGSGIVVGYDLGMDWPILQYPFVMVRGKSGDLEYVHADYLTTGGVQ